MASPDGRVIVRPAHAEDDDLLEHRVVVFGQLEAAQVAIPAEQVPGDLLVVQPPCGMM